MNPNPIIRAFEGNDIADACEVVKRSVKSCIIDHCDNQATVDKWVIKAQAILFQGMPTPNRQNADNIVVYPGTDMGARGIIGVAAVRFAKRSSVCSLILNYVHPTHTGFGVGSDMVDYLENLAVCRGKMKMKLISTATARPFYYKLGFREVKPPTAGAGVSWNHHMEKLLWP